MGDIQSIHALITHFNADLASEILPANVARRIVNARTDAPGAVGIVQNVKSNTLVRNDNLPDGEYPVVEDTSSLAVGDYYGGGIIADIDSESGYILICSKEFIDNNKNWDDAVAASDSFVAGGYTDWRLPTKEELTTIRTNLYLLHNSIANLKASQYWTEEEDESGLPEVGDIVSGGIVVSVDEEAGELLLLAQDYLTMGGVSWDVAKATSELNSYRLPTKEELTTIRMNIYLSHNDVANLEASEHWSVDDLGEAITIPEVGDIMYGGIVADVDIPNNKILILHEDYLSGVQNWAIADALCTDLVSGGYSDWRLPTIEEILLIYHNVFVGLENDVWHELQNYYHWTSYVSSPYAYAFTFHSNSLAPRLLTDQSLVRAVRVVEINPTTGAWELKMSDGVLEYKTKSNSYLFRPVWNVPIVSKAWVVGMIASAAFTLEDKEDSFYFCPVRVLNEDSSEESSPEVESFNKIIGWGRYEKRNAIVYLIYNNLGEDSIWMYDIETKSISRVLQQNYPTDKYWKTYLNFSLKYRITHVNIIGDIMYWVDGLNYPRRYNLAEDLRSRFVPIQYSLIGDESDTDLVIKFSGITLFHYFVVGQSITVSGTGNDTLDGTYVLTQISWENLIIAEHSWDEEAPLSLGYVLTEPLIDEFAITNIVEPPSTPIAYYGSDETINQNNIRGKTFQFATRYIAEDNSFSVLSAASASPIPYLEFDYSGEILFDRQKNNYIDVEFGLGGARVKIIDLLVREGNTGNWGVVATFNKEELGLTGSATHSFRFYNNISVLPVDQKESYRYLDLLPDAAKAQEFIDDKYLIYGGCLEGRENIAIDVEFNLIEFDCTPTVETDPLLADDYTYFEMGEDLGWTEPTWVDMGSYIYSYSEARITIPADSIDGREVGDTIRFAVEYHRNSYKIQTLVLEESHLVTLGTFIQAIVDTVNSAWAQVTYSTIGTLSAIVTVVLPDTYYLLLKSEDIDKQAYGFKCSLKLYKDTEESDISIVTDMDVQFGAKMGSTYKFALIYYDSLLRPFTAQTDIDSKIYIPFYTEVAGASKNDFGYNIGWKIMHDPPDWASGYKWAFSSNTPEFIQYVILGVSTREEEESGEEEEGEDPFVLVDISPLNKITDSSYASPRFNRVSYSNSIIPAYEFKAGDRIRFITKKYVSPLLGEANDWPPSLISFEPEDSSDYFGNIIDLEILGYYTDEDDLLTDKLMVQKFDYDTYNIGSGSLVEIYTPVKDRVEDYYYELPEFYPIFYSDSEGKRIHASQDVTSTDAEAVGTFGKLDVFRIHRAMSQQFQSVGRVSVGDERWNVESRHFCDFFKSDTYDIGRLNVYDAKAKRTWRNIIRRSNSFLYESNINGLSTFEGANFEVFSSQFGDITGLAYMGFALTVIQEHKLTSVYIGRSGLTQADQDGREMIVAVDRVFGTTYRSEDDYGCKNPESILKVARYLYFFDITNRAIVRKSANGNIDITKYGIKEEINLLGDKMVGLDADEVWVVSGYDSVNDEVLFSFVFNTTDKEAHTYVFSEMPVFGEDSNRWKFYYTLDDGYGTGVDLFANLGSTFIAFMDGEIWLMNQGTDRLNLFGVEREMSLELVVNKEPFINKKFRNLAVISNDNWSAQDYEDIVIPSVDLSGIDGVSRLVAESFNLDRDGKRWATFKRNAVTSSLTPNQKDLITGKDLQGHLMFLRLRNSNSSPVYLKSVIVNCSSIK